MFLTREDILGLSRVAHAGRLHTGLASRDLAIWNPVPHPTVGALLHPALPLGGTSVLLLLSNALRCAASKSRFSVFLVSIYTRQCRTVAAAPRCLVTESLHPNPGSAGYSFCASFPVLKKDSKSTYLFPRVVRIQTKLEQCLTYRKYSVMGLVIFFCSSQEICDSV